MFQQKLPNNEVESFQPYEATNSEKPTVDRIVQPLAGSDRGKNEGGQPRTKLVFLTKDGG